MSWSEIKQFFQKKFQRNWCLLCRLLKLNHNWEKPDQGSRDEWRQMFVFRGWNLRQQNQPDDGRNQPRSILWTRITFSRKPIYLKCQWLFGAARKLLFDTDHRPEFFWNNERLRWPWTALTELMRYFYYDWIIQIFLVFLSTQTR